MNDLLLTLGLSTEAKKARLASIGGSDANTIMGGHADRILRLWREKRGEAEPEDLSDNLAVQMGSFTEPLNRAWYEKQTGAVVTLAGEVCRSDDNGFPMGCTLDGIGVDVLCGDRWVFEAKHCGTRSTDAEIFARYVPQLTHNCIVAGFDRAVLSVLKGNGDWCMFEYAMDGDYAAALIEREEAFWRCVQSAEPPVPLPPVPGPKPVGVREYDLTGSNEWAAHAADYLETMLAADRHEIAKKSLKSLVPDDASRCFGHGVAINRTKAGALRFANMEA